MLTRPSKFEQFQRRDGGHRFVIVKVTDGSSTWLLSDVNMHLADGTPVYNLLKGKIQTREEINFIRHEAIISNVTLTFHNVPYLYYGADKRLSEQWAGLGYDNVYIYLGAGPNVTSLSDCLIIFSGKIVTPMSYTETTVTIVAADSSSQIHRNLPSTFTYDIYPNVPLENRYIRLPIIYGDFTELGTANGDKLATGCLAPTVLVGGDKFCLSDHPLYSANGLWLWVDALNMACEMVYLVNYPEMSAVTALDNDDSGRGTAIVRTTGSHTYAIAYAYLYPRAVYETADTYQNDATNPLNASSDNSEYAIIVSSGNYLSVYFLDDFGPDDVGSSYNNDVGRIADVHVQIRLQAAPGASVSSGTVYVKSTSNTESVALAIPGTIYLWQSEEAGTQLLWVSSGHEINWLLNRGNVDSMGPILLSLLASGTPGGSGLVNVYSFRIRIKFEYQYSIVKKAFSEVKGRMFGSWIDNDPDAGNGYNAGDLIKHAPYILESILIDELGEVIGNVDQATFDAAWNELMEMRVAIHNDEVRNSADIISEICQQSMCVLYRSASGIWRLLSWDREYVVTENVIPFSDIIPGTFEVTFTSYDEIVNELTIHHGYRYDKNDYDEVTVTTDSTSQSQYGTRAKDINFRYLTNDAVALLAPRLSGANGIWSRQWPFATFTTYGFSQAHLELGDYVRFNDLEYDARVPLLNGSWKGMDLMIIAKQQTLEGTVFKVMLTPGRITPKLDIIHFVGALTPVDPVLMDIEIP